MESERLAEEVEDERNNRLILNRSALASLKSKTLFYPCSGNDFDIPITLFSPFVNDFWFVDRGYFVPGHPDTGQFGLDAPANKQAPVLESNDDYKLIETEISGPPVWKRSNPDIEPCILTEKYRHIPSRKIIRVRRRRGYGFSAFRQEIRSLGVFFYRGDSEGEGGSGNLWLAPVHVVEICSKLVDGGLIVTDGSQHGGRQASERGEYRQLAKYHWQDTDEKITDDFIMAMESFTDNGGRNFTCVGYAGHRYGPTLIWRVSHKGSAAKSCLRHPF